MKDPGPSFASIQLLKLSNKREAKIKKYQKIEETSKNITDISRRRQISRNIKDISRRRQTLIMLWKDTPQLCAVLQRKYKKSSKWQIPNYCIYNISIVIWICWMKCQMYKVKYSTVGNQVNIIFEYCWFLIIWTTMWSK